MQTHAYAINRIITTFLLNELVEIDCLYSLARFANAIQAESDDKIL